MRSLSRAIEYACLALLISPPLLAAAPADIARPSVSPSTDRSTPSGAFVVGPYYSEVAASLGLAGGDVVPCPGSESRAARRCAVVSAGPDVFGVAPVAALREPTIGFTFTSTASVQITGGGALRVSAPVLVVGR